MKRKSLVFVTGMSLALLGLLAISSPASAQGPRGGNGAGMGPGRGGPGIGNVSGPMLRDVIDRPALVAEALGMTADELQAAHAEGKTLLDLLAEKGIDMQDFQDRLQELEEAAIAQAVADGRITQEQADLLKARASMRGQRGPGRGSCEPGTGPREPIGPREPGAGRGRGV